MDTARALADHLVGAGIITQKQRTQWLRQLSGGADEDPKVIPGLMISEHQTLRRRIQQLRERHRNLLLAPTIQNLPERKALMLEIRRLEKLLPEETTDNPETLPSGERENLDPTSGGGPGASGIRHMNRGMKGQIAPLALQVASNIIENRGNPIGIFTDLVNTASGGSGVGKKSTKAKAKTVNKPANSASKLLEDLKATLAKSKESTAAFEKMMAQYAKPAIPSDIPERPSGPSTDSPRVRKGVAAAPLDLGSIKKMKEESDSESGEEGSGKNRIDFKNIEWGSFTKQWKRFQQKTRTGLSMKEFATYIIEHPMEFKKITRERANFYKNFVLRGGSDTLDTLETVTSLGENVPGVIGRVSRIANVGAQIGQTAEKEKKLLDLQQELKRRIEAQQSERQAIMRKYAPSSRQEVQKQFNFFRFMENPTAFKRQKKFRESRGQTMEVSAPTLSQEQTNELNALAQKYQIPTLQAEIQSLQDELAANPISTDGISGVVSSVIGNGKYSSTYLQIARRYAKAAGYDPKRLTLAVNQKHKLQYKTPAGQIVPFGSSTNKDYILYQLENPTIAETRRKAYLKRSAGIKGNWATDLYSANNLARRILWGGADEEPTNPMPRPAIMLPESDPIPPTSVYTGPKPSSPKPLAATKPKYPKSNDPKPLSGGRCRFCNCVGCTSTCMDE